MFCYCHKVAPLIPVIHGLCCPHCQGLHLDYEVLYVYHKHVFTLTPLKNPVGVMLASCTARTAVHWSLLTLNTCSACACVVGEVTDTITRVRTEQGLLTYLGSLKALKNSDQLRNLRAITRLRLQSELYSLTSPGGC